MSKIKLTGSNSGYVEIDSAADAGNLTLSLPTSGTRLLSNTDNVFSGITTTAELDINGKIDVSTDIVGGRNLKVTGITTLSDDVTLTGASYNVLWDKSDNQLEFGDNAKLSFGASSDLQIYHNGSNSMIEDHGTGNLEIRTNGTKVTLQGGGNPMINALKDAQVELYHNNSKKLETASGGVTVTGTVAATSYTGDGSALTGISVGIATTASQVSGITTVIDLNKDDIRLDCTGLVTIDTQGGTEGNNHVLRIVNSGISTVTFSSYFKFPSGGTPALPTASGAISLISFTVHTQGRVGVASVFLAGASVNFS